MENDFYTNSGIDSLLQRLGLVVIGSLPVTDRDRLTDLADDLPLELAGKLTVGQLLLVGNGGSTFWPVFSRSPEFTDGRADPLDRWSRRVGNQLATDLGGRAIFPFEGPPYPPFLAWAARTGKAVSSRLSLYIHERFGLWHAYRFALAIPSIDEESAPCAEFKSPCLSCEDKPCLEACPVNAFGGPSYRVDLCMDYLRSDADSACRQLGCASRRACPVGKVFTYLPEHARFHMTAFVRSRHV